MPLDGAMLTQVKHELEGALGSRVDRVTQPSREELILALRSRQGASRILISVNAGSPRIHFTQAAVENPKTPPMFCMLMRKLLGAAQFTAVRQVGMDRILELDFLATDDLGDPITYTLSAEIMGRHSNLIVRRPDGRIVDSLKRVDTSMSSLRPVLPGLTYTLPPSPAGRLELLTASPREILEKLRAEPRQIELSRRLQECLTGVSPLLCREIAFFTVRGAEKTAFELTADEEERFCFYLEALTDAMRRGACTPTMLLTPDGTPKDFSFTEIRQYGAAMQSRTYPTYGELLDAFYAEKDAADRMRQRSGDLQRLLGATHERILRRLDNQRRELAESTDREKYKIYGDLLAVNLYQLKKGDREAKVQNYYEPDCPEVTIPLDVRLTPSQNVQRCYWEYRRRDTAEKKLREQIAAGEAELAYIESVTDLLDRAGSEADLTAIRRELSQEGYLKHYAFKGKKEERLAPLRFRSDDGFTILVGRNNVQNDRLTLRESRGNDIWFHTQKIPGSHVIVVTEGREVPDRTLEQAAILAATHSRASQSAKVPVDYTQVRYVKKPSGAKPGMVIYDPYQTAIVDPDKELAERLRVTEK